MDVFSQGKVLINAFDNKCLSEMRFVALDANEHFASTKLSIILFFHRELFKFSKKIIMINKIKMKGV